MLHRKHVQTDKRHTSIREHTMSNYVDNARFACDCLGIMEVQGRFFKEYICTCVGMWDFSTPIEVAENVNAVKILRIK